MVFHAALGGARAFGACLREIAPALPCTLLSATGSTSFAGFVMGAVCIFFLIILCCVIWFPISSSFFILRRFTALLSDAMTTEELLRIARHALLYLDVSIIVVLYRAPSFFLSCPHLPQPPCPRMCFVFPFSARRKPSPVLILSVLLSPVLLMFTSFASPLVAFHCLVCAVLYCISLVLVSLATRGGMSTRYRVLLFSPLYFA